MVNAILSNSDLSQGFGMNVVLTTCYILHRILTKRSPKTTYELWNKIKPSLNTREFGVSRQLSRSQNL